MKGCYLMPNAEIIVGFYAIYVTDSWRAASSCPRICSVSPKQEEVGFYAAHLTATWRAASSCSRMCCISLNQESRRVLRFLFNCHIFEKGTLIISCVTATIIVTIVFCSTSASMLGLQLRGPRFHPQLDSRSVGSLFTLVPLSTQQRVDAMCHRQSCLPWR